LVETGGVRWQAALDPERPNRSTNLVCEPSIVVAEGTRCSSHQLESGENLVAVASQ
jgi:hypothetical protein